MSDDQNQKSIRLLVCGGRDYNDREAMWSYLDQLVEQRWPVAVLIQSVGPAGGPLRNQRMLDDGKPDLVVAFPGGKGTADMVRRARAAGVEVIEVAGG